MKKKYILGLAALSVLALAAGTTTVMAASSNGLLSGNGVKARQGQNLTTAQIAEMKTKREAAQTALSNGDYSAWVTAEKALNENSPMLSKVTADNFATYVQEYKDRELKRTEMQTKIETVRTALNNGNYTSWVAAEKAVNENSPVLEKITAANFSKYVEAHNLREQANTIMKDLGLDQGREMGMGNGLGMGRGDDGAGAGMGRGHGRMMDSDKSETISK